MALISIKDASNELFEYYPQMGDPEKITTLVRRTALVTAATVGVGSLVPILSIPAFITGCVVAVWHMYIKLCNLLGIKLKDSLLKVLARIAISNISANIGLLFLGMLIPGVSVLEDTLLSYVSVYIAAQIFLTTITKLVKLTNDPYGLHKLSESVIKDELKRNKPSKSDSKNAIEDYNKHKDDIIDDDDDKDDKDIVL